jgi:U4/U6.U5 tri-snRNP-associated protein 3
MLGSCMQTLGRAADMRCITLQVDFDADITPEEMQMMAAMGIPFGFDTTQGKHVDDDAANAGAVKAKQTRRARQYMNRRGGFNRPLPAERTGEVVPRD